MIKKIDIFLVLLLLLLSISAVSAADDADEVISSDDTITDIVTSNADESLSVDVENDELLTASSYTVTSSNYGNYFNSKGNLISSSVKAGDTLNIDGTFNGKNFIFNKTLNIKGTSSNNLKNCVFTFYSGASGSTISNLKITNTNDYLYGVFLNGASNCTVQGCVINNTGQASYGICVANQANNNTVINNVITTYGQTYGHLTRSTPPMVLSNAHYNYIANNNIACDDANGIYLSSYEGGPLEGGESTFNTIYANTVKYNVLPTSWAYGIQVMGGHNNISSNRIIGAYRGISTSSHGNIIEDNWIINLTGADYNNPGVPSGAEIAIVGSYESIIKNNHIVNARVISTGAGITVLDNSTVENNYVEVLLQGKGMHPQGSNITIKNNTIITASGSGILYNTYSHDLRVLNNNITSQTGIGVLIQKLSNSKMPSNITIVGNYISTSNKYAIDAAEADASSTNVIKSNHVKKGCQIRTPEGSYDPSKPAYIFNGTVHNINPSNIGNYINDNGGLSSDIKDGDILNFTGEFNNRVIYINSAIKITGDNPVFYNTTFRISCDGVWIEKLVIRNEKAERLNAWGVLAYRIAGATITNCNIYVNDPNAAYAIYVVEASDVDVINNTLSSSGDYLTYTLLAYAVEDCKFINNTINTIGTGVVHKFENQHCLDGDTNCLDGDTNCLDGDTNCLDGDTNCLDGDTNCLDGDTNCLDGDTNCLDGNSVCTDGNSIGDGNHVLSEVYRTYGILMAYSSGNNVTGNKVNVTSKLNEVVSTYNSTNSLVGIDLYFNSHDNIFSDNEVYITAKDNYIYGMGVLGYTTGHDAPEGQGALNNQFINNYIVIKGTYCVEGIIIGHESHDTIIKDNTINLKSDNVAYGITLEMSQKSDISGNYLTLNSDVIYGIEAFSSNNNTINNNNQLKLNAKQVYGILLSNSNYNSIVSNIISANGTGEAISFNNFDSISAGNAGIFLKSNSIGNEIRMNTITSQKGYAVLVDDKAIDNTIADNCLDSQKGIGNRAVSNIQDNVVENNYRYTFGGRFTAFNANYLETAVMTVKSIDNGALVRFYLSRNDKDYDEIGSVISSNGEATLNYKIDDSLTPGSYRINAVVTKENYKTKQFSRVLFTVKKGSLNVALNDVSAKKLTEATFVATVSDVSGRPLSCINVKFYRVHGSSNTYFGVATTGSNGIAKLVSQIPSIDGDEFEIYAQVDSNSNFNQAKGYATLTLNNKNGLNLTLKDISANPGDQVTFTATVKDDSDNPVSGLNIKFYMLKNGQNSLIGSASTGSNGVAKVSYNVSSTFDGSNFISAKFDGNSNFNPVVDQAILKSKKNTLNFVLDDVSSYVSADTTFTANVKDLQGHVISGLNVKFYIIKNGKNSTIGSATTGSDGVAKLNYTLNSIAAGSYAISASFAGNTNYYPANGQATLSVEKYDLNIDVDDVNVVYKDGGELVATLTNAVTGKAVNGINIVVSINGMNYTVKTNSKGKASISTDGLIPKTYTAKIAFSGNNLYNSASASAKVVVKKADTNLAVEGIVITLKDVYGDVISNAPVSVKIGGITSTLTTDKDGKATIPKDGLAPKTYVAKVTFSGNELYKGVTTSENVAIRLDTVLTADDVIVAYNNRDNVIVTLKDVNGAAISGVKVKVVVGGLSKIAKTDANGQVSLDISSLGIGEYKISARSAVTDTYEEAKASAKLSIVDKFNTTLTIPNVDILYNTPGAAVVATLKDVYGNIVSGVKVKIVVGDLTNTAKTDANGKVSLDISGLAPGEYKISARSATTDIYNEAKGYAKLTINKFDAILLIPNVAAVYNTAGDVVATLKDTGGNIISGVKVKIVVGDLTKTAKTDANGQVSLDISSLAPGEYKISSRSATTEIYNEVKAYAKAYVSADKVDTTLTIPNVDVVYNTPGAAVVATLKDEYGNIVSDVKVKVVVGNLTKTIKTDANGQVSVDISDLAPGEYKISARSATTDIYNEDKAYAKATVNKIDPTLTIPNVATVYNTAGAVVATLKDNNGNAISGVKVKLVVGDLTTTVKTDANGQVSLDISGLAPGEYKVSARSATTDIYNEVKAYAKAYVSADKLTPTLTIPNVATVYNAQGFVVATLKDMYGNAISGVKVKLVVGDLTTTVKTDANGQVSLDISGLAPGEYKVSARSATTDIYNEVKAYAKVTVSANKLDPTLTVPNVNIKKGTAGAAAVATLKDMYGNAISGVKVKLVVGDLTTTVKTDANGQVSLDISDLEVGEYKVSARSAATDVYNEVKAYAKAIIS